MSVPLFLLVLGVIIYAVLLPVRVTGLCAVCVDCFSEPCTAHIDREVAQTPPKGSELSPSLSYKLKVFGSLSSDRTSSEPLLLERVAIPILLRNPLTLRILAIVFTGSGIPVKNADFLPKISQTGQRKLQICFYATFYTVYEKYMFLGLHTL